MSKIAIVTDSTAYLPADTIHTYDITVIPLAVGFGQDSYKEGVDIVAVQFYPRMAAEKNLPTTSQPAVGEMVATFERLLETHDAIIAIMLSSGLSGTVNSAETAARMVGGDITVIDSKITSGGLSALVLQAAQLVAEGADKEQVVAETMRLRDKIRAYFVVDSLEHLHRGGRISGVSALLGSLLQVKPLLYVNDGRLDLYEKVRTRKKALARVIELTRQDLQGQKGHLTLVYANNREDAEQFRDQIVAEFPDCEVLLSELGPVIGTHVGPGLLALIFYPM